MGGHWPSRLGWVAKSLGCVARSLGWVAKSVARQLATAALWVRIQTSLKNHDWACAAGFALLNLPKGKSLGRSKPATNSSNEQAH